MTSLPAPVRILNVEPAGYARRAREILEKIGVVADAPPGRAELLQRVGEADALIVRLAHRVDEELLDRAPRLRVVMSATTGLDHIDLEATARRGIEVLSLGGEDEFLRAVVATAEHTWALLLALVRRIPSAFASVRAGEWERDRFRGTELAGRRLGLLGLGRLGTQVAAYGRTFGMHVHAFDPYVAPWPRGVEEVPSLERLLENSDVLSVHVPLNAETTGMLDGRALGLLPRGAVLVNTSRGGIVDEEALVTALSSGRLAGAALDVVVNERHGAARRAGAVHRYLQEHDNLLVTPHIGGATYESMEKTEIFMAEKLARFFDQRNPPGAER